MDVTFEDISRRIAEKLTSCGWIKDDLSSTDGYCLEGAFHAVVADATGLSEAGLQDWSAGLPEPYELYWERLCALVREEHWDGGPLGPFMFNDLPETSLEDVLLLVKRTGEP